MTKDLSAKCKALLEANGVKEEGRIYTKPSPGCYDFLWLWDSCFHALIWSYFDIQRVVQELEAVFAGQGLDGMLPHMICFDKEKAKEKYHSPNGGIFKLWNKRGTSNLTQPPVLGLILWKVYQRTKNKKILERFFDKTLLYYNALKTKRDPDKDGLISIIHPWESGWDDSPRWDVVYGLKNPSKDKLTQIKVYLIDNYWDMEWNIGRIAKKDIFNVESVDFNSIYLSGLNSLIKIAGLLKRKEKDELLEGAKKTSNAIQGKMWHKDGYYDLFGKDERIIDKKTPAMFFPMFAELSNEDQAKRLIETYKSEFLTDYPVPTIALSDPAFDPKRYWRGTTWININWFVVQGFENYGFHKEAKNIFKKSNELIKKSGFREYYNPLTGEGLGAKNFSWSALILDLI
jgi:hypothetical protein